MADLIRAFLDIGTNSLNLLVMRCAPERTESLHDAERVTRLGEGAIESGKLQHEAVERTLAAISDIVGDIRAFSPQSLEGIGTWMLAHASNRALLLDPLYKHLGIRVRLLSREEETVAGFLAARTEFPGGSLATLDVGGGSSELAHGEGSLPDTSASYPLGSRRLLAEIPVSDPPLPGEVDTIREAVRGILSGIDPLPRNSRLVLIGSAAKALAGYARTLLDAPANVVAKELHPETLERLVRLLSSMTIAERRELPGSDPERADVILHGAIVVREWFDALEAEVAGVSLAGLSLGIIEAERLAAPLETAPKTIKLPKSLFPPLTRKDREGEVIFLLRRHDGSVWLQQKHHYPDGIFRLPGGGVDIGESLRGAIIREVIEETGIESPRPVPLGRLAYNGPKGESINFSSTLFLVDIGDKPPVCTDPEEQVSGWKAVEPENLANRADKLQSLTGELSAWGAFRAAALRYALELHRRGSW